MKNGLKTEKEINKVILDSIGEAVIIVDASGRTIVNCNSATERVFGYSKEELIGQNTSILHVNREYYNRFGEESEAILRSGEVYKGEFRMKRKDGTIIDTYHTVSSFQEERGWEKGVVSVVRDITDQKRAEQMVKRNLQDRKLLLAEIHHRVKNNLAIMASLLYMQIEAADNEDVKSNLRTSYCRLQSIAVVHEQLYHKAELDSVIYLDSYLLQLSESIDQIIVLPDKKVTVGIDSEQVAISLLQAVSLGLLLSELLVNAYQHAFKERERGHIQINAFTKNSRLSIEVTDDGSGLPEDFSMESSTIGFGIVKILVQQLNGDFSYKTSPGKGTLFTVSFELSE